MIKRIMHSYYWRKLCDKTAPRRAWAMLMNAFYWLFIALVSLLLLRGAVNDPKGYVVVLLFVLLGFSLRSRGILNRRTIWAYWAGFFGAYGMLFSHSVELNNQMRAGFYQLINTSYAQSRTESRPRLGLTLSELSRMRVPENAEFFRVSDTLGTVIPYFADDTKLLRDAKREFCNILGSRDDWDGLQLYDIDLADSGFVNMALRNVGFLHCSFAGGVLAASDFSHSRFAISDFGGPYAIHKCAFNGADFSFPTFRGGRLSDSDFSAALIMEPRFLNMRMENVSFTMAHIRSALFPGSVVAETRFAGAVLEQCSFRNATLGRVFYAPLDDAISRRKAPLGRIFTPILDDSISRANMEKAKDYKALAALAPKIALAVLHGGEPEARAVWETFVKENTPIFETGYWEHLWPSGARVFLPDFTGAALFECDFGSFTLLDPAGNPAITVDDATADQKVLERLAPMFENAATLYGTRFPKHLDALLRERAPHLFAEEAGRAALQSGKQARERALSGMGKRLRSPVVLGKSGPQW